MAFEENLFFGEKGLFWEGECFEVKVFGYSTELAFTESCVLLAEPGWMSGPSTL